MIKLTRLDGEAFVLNAELIRYVETRPDTFITLTTGERLIVLEDMNEVLRRAVDYQRSKHLFPTAMAAAPAEPLPTGPARSTSERRAIARSSEADTACALSAAGLDSPAEA